MTRKKNEIENDLEKIRQTLAKIQEEQNQLKGQEETAQRSWEEEMLDIGSSEMPQTLKAIRARSEDLQAAGAAGDRKLKALKLELDEFLVLEQAKGRDIFMRELRKNVDELRQSMSNLIGQFQEVIAAIHDAEQSGIAANLPQDTDIILHGVINLDANLAPELRKSHELYGALLARWPK